MIRRILVDGWTAEAAEKEAVAIGLKSPNLKDFVREYVAQGTVFGIAWNGPHMPDLQSLLGNYFPQYVKGIDAQRAAGVRGAVNVQTTGLAVQSGGHMGSFFGRAWLPQGLPSGVTADDIR